MAVIQHLALPVMMVVILCASIMLAPVDAMSHTGTSTARRPTTTAAPSDYIARRVYYSLTNKYIGTDGSTTNLEPITKNQIRRKTQEKSSDNDDYDYSGNEFLGALTGPQITFDVLRGKIRDNDYRLMEAALRVCVYKDEWRKQLLNDSFPKSIADHAIGKLGLKSDIDHASSSQLAEALKSYRSPSRNN